MDRIGVIKWFDEVKGFGLIASTNNEEYFLHRNNFNGITDDLRKGSAVCFFPAKIQGKKSPPAKSCRNATIEDLNAALRLLKNNRKISIEITLRGKSKWGNPYVKKEYRNYDILDLYLRSVVRNLKFSDFLELLTSAWKSQINSWTNNQIADLIGVLSSSFGSIKFEKEDIPETNQVTDSLAIRLWLPNYGLVDQVLERLKKELTEVQKFNLWSLNIVKGFRDSKDLYGFKDETVKNKTLPFEEKLLVANFSELSPDVFERLKNYSLSPNIIADLKKGFSSTVIDNEENLNRELEYCQLLPVSERNEYNKQILAKIDSALYLSIWASTKFKIEHKDGIILKLKWGYSNENNFLPPKNTVFEAAHNIDETIAKKLITFGGEGLNLLTQALSSVNFEKCFIDERLFELIKSTRVLCKEKQFEVFQRIVPRFYQSTWEIAIDENWIDIHKRELNFLGHPISLDPYQTRFLTEALVSKYHNETSPYKRNRDTIVKVLSFLSPDSYSRIFDESIEMLSNEEIVVLLRNLKLSNKQVERLAHRLDFSNEDSCSRALDVLASMNYSGLKDLLKQNEKFVTEFSDERVCDLLRDSSTDFLKKHLIINGDLTNLSVLEGLLPHCTDEELRTIKKKVDESDQTLDRYNSIFYMYQKLEIPFYPTRYQNYFEGKCDTSDLIEAVRLCKKLPKKEQDRVRTLFENNVDYKVFHHEKEILNFLENCFTSDMQKELILAIESSIVLESVFNFLIEKDGVNILTMSDLKSVIRLGLKNNAKACIQFSLNVNSELAEYAIGQIGLNDENYKEIIDCVESNFIIITDLSIIGFSTLALLIKALLSKSDDEAIELYKEFHISTDYAYQTIVFLLVCKLIHNTRLPKWHEDVVLEKTVQKQLGIRLIQQFMSSHNQKADELMQKLNITLKDHFKILDSVSISQNEFRNIFSIKHLVKKCDGRKTVNGLSHWKRGQVERYYSKGNRWVFFKESYTENIYCEGRLWKTLQVWSSEGNNPTGESQTLYWCKGNSCAGVNIKSDLDLPVSEWTLSEITELKLIKIDRLFFTNVAGWLNKMKTIFDRLHCYECNSLLRPLAFVPQKLGFYAVPLFHCINQSCGLFEMKIRFTHCLGCKKILDSRECRTCSKCNWLECDDSDCGRCGCGSNHLGVYAQY